MCLYIYTPYVRSNVFVIHVYILTLEYIVSRIKCIMSHLLSTFAFRSQKNQSRENCAISTFRNTDDLVVTKYISFVLFRFRYNARRKIGSVNWALYVNNILVYRRFRFQNKKSRKNHVILIMNTGS